MAGSQAGRIDIHHHFFAPEYLGAMGANAKRPEVSGWSLAHTFEEMEKNGVETAMLSLSPPGIHLGDRDATKKLARAVNEHAVRLRAEHPARFGHFASVPMPHVDDTLTEIAYALDTLKADGIQLMTSYHDKWPGHAASTRGPGADCRRRQVRCDRNHLRWRPGSGRLRSAGDCRSGWRHKPKNAWLCR